ncbi:MAG: AbrB/MazE/SpoVT family DNA-binding domain-containing protein [Panacagrimonas sp.]
MQVSKWGNSLALRLPAALVQELGLKEGDEVELAARKLKSGAPALEVARQPTREEVIESLREFRWRMPKDYKFDREEANARK